MYILNFLKHDKINERFRLTMIYCFVKSFDTISNRKKLLIIHICRNGLIKIYEQKLFLSIAIIEKHILFEIEFSAFH